MKQIGVMSWCLVAVLGGVCAGGWAQPTRDPNLDPSMQEDYRPEDHQSVTEAPPSDWQVAHVIATPFGAVYYLVDDADAFVRQLPDAVARRVVIRRRAQTGLGKDLVIDPAGNRPGTRQLVHGGNNTGFDVDNSTGGARFGFGGFGSFATGWGSFYQIRFPLRGAVGDPELRYLYVGPIDGGYSPGYQPAASEPDEPVPPPTALGLGLEALRFGRIDDAVKLLRGHMDEFPDDSASARVLALALLEANRPGDAASLMRLAYVRDPRLGSWAIEGSKLLDDGTGGSGRLRKLGARAGKHAARVDSASGWLLACVITQARDKPKPALTLLERAAGRGLDGDVVRVLRVELERR